MGAVLECVHVLWFDNHIFRIKKWEEKLIQRLRQYHRSFEIGTILENQGGMTSMIMRTVLERGMGVREDFTGL